MSALVHNSKSHLSKVETGVKPPGADLARQCDAALSADGALNRLASPRQGTVSSPPTNAEDGEVWLMTMDAYGRSAFPAVFRRALLGGVAAGAVMWRLSGNRLIARR